MQAALIVPPLREISSTCPNAQEESKDYLFANLVSSTKGPENLNS
jgi:hypothetical protein